MSFSFLSPLSRSTCSMTNAVVRSGVRIQRLSTERQTLSMTNETLTNRKNNDFVRICHMDCHSVLNLVALP
jgi:aminoglycoside phosphotransferase family enzyme